MYEPTIESIEQDFPGWHVWQGVNDRWYARLPRTSPPWVAGAEDLTRLRDRVLGYSECQTPNDYSQENGGCSV